jgi:hypothetical protein
MVGMGCMGAFAQALMQPENGADDIFRLPILLVFIGYKGSLK